MGFNSGFKVLKGTIHTFLGTLPIFIFFRKDLTLRSYDGTHLHEVFQ